MKQKNPSINCGIPSYKLLRVVPKTPETIETLIATTFGHPAELVSKALLLWAPPKLVTECGEIKLVATWALPLPPAFMMLKALRTLQEEASNYPSYPATVP